MAFKNLEFLIQIIVMIKNYFLVSMDNLNVFNAYILECLLRIEL